MRLISNLRGGFVCFGDLMMNVTSNKASKCWVVIMWVGSSLIRYRQSDWFVDHGILITCVLNHSICCPTLCSIKATSPNSPRNPYYAITKEIPRFNNTIALSSKIRRFMQYHGQIVGYSTRIQDLYTIGTRK